VGEGSGGMWRHNVYNGGWWGKPHPTWIGAATSWGCKAGKYSGRTLVFVAELRIVA